MTQLLKQGLYLALKFGAEAGAEGMAIGVHLSLLGEEVRFDGQRSLQASDGCPRLMILGY